VRRNIPCTDPPRTRTRFSARRSAAPPILGAALSLSLLAGCSGAARTETTVPSDNSYRYPPIGRLTSERIATATGTLSVLLPVGWKETVDQRNAPNIALWLVREDYGASLSFAPMRMDPALYRALRKDGALAIAKVSLSLKKGQARDTVSVIHAPESFRLNGRDYAAYEYSVTGGRTAIRVVVFDAGNGFYECILLPASPTISPEENRRLFELQQSVLASAELP
jgi:hypothetical protein